MSPNQSEPVHDEPEKQLPPAEVFRFEDSLFYPGLAKLRMGNNPSALVIALLCITWLPLFVMNAIKGTLWSGTAIPFLKDAAIEFQLLLALPMLILITPYIFNKANEIIQYITGTLVQAEEQQRFNRVTLISIKKWLNSIWPDIIILLIVVARVINKDHHRVFDIFENETTSWMLSGNSGVQSMNFAGYWAAYFSIPLFQFIFLRWIWRYLVWVCLLYRIARMKLKLIPLHADRTGGLGILMLAQRYFSLVFIASGAVISGRLMVEIYNHPESFNVIRNEVIGYVVLCIVLLLFPLLFFTRKLLATKHQSMVRQSRLSADINAQFTEDWVNDLPFGERLKQRKIEPQMVNAHLDLYSMLQQFRVIPVTVLDIVVQCVLLLLPFIPILFIYFSTMQLVQKIIGLLF